MNRPNPLVENVIVHDVGTRCARLETGRIAFVSRDLATAVSGDHESSRLTKMDDEILQPRSVAATQFQ